MLSGPAETGKTWAACWYLDTFLRTFPGAQGVMLRKVRADVLPTVLQTYRRVAQLRGGVTPYGGSNPEWFDYENGSRLWLGGIDNPGKTLSAERDIIYVNQAEQLDVSDWETLSTRSTGRGAVAPYTVLLGDCNPGAGDHWILKRAAAGALTLRATSHRDNPSLYDDAGELTPQGERSLASLGRLTGLRRRRLLGGEWVGAEGQYFEHWSDELHVRRTPAAALTDWILWGSLDYGYNHYTAFGVYAKGREGIIWKVAEFTGRRMLIKQLSEGMLATLDAIGVKRGRLRKIVAGRDIWDARPGDDESDPLTIERRFHRLGWVLTKANTARISGAQELAGRLGNPHATPPIPATFFVDPRCVRTIAQIPAMVADPARPEDVRKVDVNSEDGTGGDDCYDETRYALMEERMPQIPLPRGVIAGAGVAGWGTT